MGIIFNFSDELEMMQSSTRIVFSKLDFITDRLGDLRLHEPESAEWEEESLQIRAFAAGLEEAMDRGPGTLIRYLKHCVHLFIEDGREGESMPTFYINKPTDLDSALDPIPIPHRPTSQSSVRLGWTATTHGEALS